MTAWATWARVAVTLAAVAMAGCGSGPGYCGDGLCAPGSGESCVSCAADCMCAGCGDGMCSPGTGESCANCPSDCGACGALCGNGVCEPSSESCSSCPGDCGSCGVTCGPTNCAGCCSGDTCLGGDATAACGRGGNMCLDCGAGFTCSSAACVVDGASQWVVAVERVALPERNYAGDAWDFPGGLPEPIVKIYVVESGGERQIGSFNGGADRLTATFVNAHTSAVSANLLLAGFVARVFDEDSLANDSVGACRFVPGVADFSGGSVVVSCPFDAATQNSGFTLTYRLERR